MAPYPLQVGPPRPTSSGADSEDDGGGSAGGTYDGDDSGGEDPWLLPVTHEVTLGGHGRTVSALDLDHTGRCVNSCFPVLNPVFSSILAGV